MSDLAKRIAHLSPERREALELLLAQEQDAQHGSVHMDQLPTDDADISASTASEDVIEAIKISQFSSFTYASDDEKKKQIKQVYTLISQQLNASPFGGHAVFLNLGYVPNENPGYATINLSEYALNKNCIRLVLEVIGDCDMSGDCAILDVGCGRGGTIAVLNQYFHPRQMIGIDLSPSAISFCQKYHTYKNTYFLEGDAENLPFSNDLFNIVINIESSHSYPDICTFYREVSRVLKMHGYFLYTDLLSIDRLGMIVECLQENGFVVERHQDITANILLSCDEIGKTRFKALSRDNDTAFMSNFLGLPGSKIYNDLQDGRTTYRLFKLKKSQAVV